MLYLKVVDKLPSTGEAGYIYVINESGIIYIYSDTNNS